MLTAATLDQLAQLEIPGRLVFQEGNGELPKMEITTDWGSAEIYLHGAHVTHFQKQDEPPLLFLSQCSRYAPATAIRGGIPIIFPWFGPRDDMPMHGFARLAEWDLHEAATVPDGGVSIRFSLPSSAAEADSPPFRAYYAVTVTDRLSLELIITNLSGDQELSLETCLHTYFRVDDIEAVSVTGLKGHSYLDKVENFALKAETSDAIRFTGETDRIYLDATGPVVIQDPKLRRRIRIEKRGSASTVVWNPGLKKAQQMPDLANDEYRQMLCVESGNVAKNKLHVPPGRSADLQVILSTEPF